MVTDCSRLSDLWGCIRYSVFSSFSWCVVRSSTGRLRRLSLHTSEAGMETIWFIIVAVMITAYVVLDGFDLGAGIIYLIAAKTDNERRAVLKAIGPVWDGNEVWLLAAGGTL